MFRTLLPGVVFSLFVCLSSFGRNGFLAFCLLTFRLGAISKSVWDKICPLFRLPQIYQSPTLLLALNVAISISQIQHFLIRKKLWQRNLLTRGPHYITFYSCNQFRIIISYSVFHCQCYLYSTLIFAAKARSLPLHCSPIK